MVEPKELAKALGGTGSLTETVEQYLLSSYGASADLRYQRARYAAALACFSSAFPETRKLSVARAPGRVNLIGEHTDYNGLPVLPMAIERDIVILFSPRKDRRINLVNSSFWYPPRSFEMSRRIRPYGQGNWGNYAKAAAQALREAVPRSLHGLNACIAGDIPSDSGLSGSSALIVAVAIALFAANNLRVDHRGLVELLARGERYVGVEGSGMDQAASLLAEPNKVLKVDFLPLTAHPVPIPSDYSFVVCNSLVRAEMVGAARDEYNRRVVECRLGVALLDSIPRKNKRRDRSITMLGGLRRLSDKEMNSAINELPDGGISLKDVAKTIGMPAAVLRDRALRLWTGELVREPRGGFKIKQRVRHVLSEGRRVEESAYALEQGDIERFGRLMNESHESCAVDYEISTPELDALAGICRESGALGARLTGIGFGGCVIALVPDIDVPNFISTVVEGYYHGYLPRERKNAAISVMALEDAIFPCKPCAGATTLT